MQKIISITIPLYFFNIEFLLFYYRTQWSWIKKYSMVIFEYNPLKMYNAKHLQDDISSTYITQRREITYIWAILSYIKLYIK